MRICKAKSINPTYNLGKSIKIANLLNTEPQLNQMTGLILSKASQSKRTNPPIIKNFDHIFSGMKLEVLNQKKTTTAPKKVKKKKTIEE